MLKLNDIKQLVEDSDGRVFSLYLNLDNSLPENQATQPAWRIFVKNALKDTATQVNDADAAAWGDINKRVQAYIDAYDPTSKGLALFYGTDLEAVYELPVAPHQNEASFGEVRVAPLLWLIDEYEQYLIVLVDSEEAHFLTTYLGDTTRQEAMASDRFSFDFREKTIMPRPTGGQDGNVTAGSHRDQFEDKIDDYVAKFHGDVAERIREWLKTRGGMRVIIGGDEKSAHAVRDALHEAVLPHIVAVMNIPFNESDDGVWKRILPVALEFEREQELTTVRTVLDMAKADGGRGVIGYDAVEQAVNMQQVELLLAPWPLDDMARFQRLTMQAFRHGNAMIELVHGPAADLLRSEGGIAARLFYTI